ncbi:hypothetical protein [Kordiimonas sp.]|uniref:hypothetical protein n=1 Tax=Kordiimonas sp. TaxID=1970157 RepID=UPI003A92D81F
MQITFEPLLEFDSRAKQGFARIAEGRTLSFYIEEHRAGRAALFAVTEKGKRQGSLLLASETKQTGEKILAVMAASLEGKVDKIIREGRAWLNSYAVKSGHATVKFYTSSPKLAAEFLKAGARAKLTWNPHHG